jgi:tetratricopeptide (TPR) repeat protein
MLVSGSRHTSAVFAGLAKFVQQWLAPDMAELEPDIVARLRALARYDDPDVRATAMAALHYVRGEDAETRRFLVDALKSLGPADDGLVRARWSVVLGFLADSLASHGDAAAAVATYRRALEITPRALESSGNSSGAEQVYRRAVALDPNESLGYFNLGNVYLKRGDAAAAIPQYERATSLNPSLAPGYLYLADAYARTGATRRALDAVRRGIEFDPKNADAKRAEETLKQALAGQR